MMNPFDLSGETAVVTGASRGIGRAIATGFLQAGASVVAMQRSTIPHTLTAIADEVGVRVILCQSMWAVNRRSRPIRDTLAMCEVDILVNNAGSRSGMTGPTFHWPTPRR